MRFRVFIADCDIYGVPIGADCDNCGHFIGHNNLKKHQLQCGHKHLGTHKQELIR